MDNRELLKRTDAAVAAFADRVPERHMAGIREMADVGEPGEAVSNLVAAIVQHGTQVTSVERDELRALVDATGEGGEWLDQVSVRADDTQV